MKKGRSKRRALSPFPFDPRSKENIFWRTCTRYSYRILGLAGTCTRHSCEILGSGELVLDILAKSWDLANSFFPGYKGNTKENGKE